jgi:hypothetical protein
MYILIFLFNLVCAYDEKLSKHFANLCQASYCISSIDDWSCKSCEPSFKLDYVVENKGALALQGFDNMTNSIFTAFRGSSNIQNWLNNIQVSKTSPYNDSTINVEIGFYKTYSYLKPTLFSNLELLSDKYKTNVLSITGHSLGGAEGTLFAYDIALDKTYTILHYFSFGSPRVGNSNFVKSFQSLSIVHYRVTHYHDIVPHIPEEFLNYLHITKEIWYNENNTNYKICKDSDFNEDSLCSNSCSPTHCSSFNDHLNYLNISLGNDVSC